MSKYIDGFVIPIANDKMAEYEKIASLAAQVWKDHGAVEYIEAAGDDLGGHPPHVKPPTELMGTQPGETLVFSYIVYNSREHRDAVNAKVMADPRMTELCPSQNPDVIPPFDAQRMMTGGFRVFVQ